MIQSVTILVSGKVQGVYYRQSTRAKALELGLTGTVRNLPDGNVLIHASGSSAAVNQLIAWCRQGPPRAEVISVQVETLEPTVFIGFVVLR